MKLEKLYLVTAILMLTSCSGPSPTAAMQKSADNRLPSSPQMYPSYPTSATPMGTPAPIAYPSVMPTTGASMAAPVTSSSGTSMPVASAVPSAEATDSAKLLKDNFFKNYGVNPFVDTQQDHLSTFGMDVDTASYTLMRNFVNFGYLPDKDSVRIEEYINYFDYNYPKPDKDVFSINLDCSPSLFGEEGSKLLRVGIAGKEIKAENRKNAVLTFAIDISGSMKLQNRLDLVKESLKLLINQLQPTDKVGIIVYGSNARIVSENKTLDSKEEIIKIIDSLTTEGATNAEDGLKVAYAQAQKYFMSGEINRVILCSDGVANVGQTSPEVLLEDIKNKKESGITLSAFGFGMGNYNDILMEQIADKGDGNYAYVDDIKEAERLFVNNLTGTLQLIAKDAKIQVDFNPAIVSQYRLLGYENRNVADQDFRNNKVDGGEIGSGHTVTALYEVKMKSNYAIEDKIAQVTLRFRDMDDNTVKELNKSVYANDVKQNFTQSSASFKLAAAVAEYAEILKNSYFAQDGKFDNVMALLKELQTSELGNNEKLKEFKNILQTVINFKNSNISKKGN